MGAAFGDYDRGLLWDIPMCLRVSISKPYTQAPYILMYSLSYSGSALGTFALTVVRTYAGEHTIESQRLCLLLFIQYVLSESAGHLQELGSCRTQP